MCLIIDYKVKSLNKRIVWKIFDKDSGKIASLYRAELYPKGKLVERSQGASRDAHLGTHGLHFYLSKAKAAGHAKYWSNSYIAKFAVDPKDFMFADQNGTTAMYERATRIGNYIKVRGKE